MLEEGGLAHVGRARIPREELALGHRQRRPAVVALEDAAVLVLEQVGAVGARERRLDLGRARPHVAQVHRPVGALAERVGGEVGVDAAGERVGDDERRRGQVVGAHRRVDAGLEVAVAREHGRHLEVVALDRARHLVRQRAGVADAGRAAEADQVEPELVERVHQPGALEIADDDPRPRREARLHPRPPPEPQRERLLGDEAGGDHQRRVGRVRARRDRRDHDRAVAQAAAVRRTDAERVRERAPDLRQRHPVLRPARAGEAGHDRPEVEVERLGVVRGRLGARAEEALLLRVALDEGDQIGRPAGVGAGSAASARRPGRWPPSPRTRATCSRAWPGRRRSASPGRARRTR